MFQPKHSAYFYTKGTQLCLNVQCMQVHIKIFYFNIFSKCLLIISTPSTSLNMENLDIIWRKHLNSFCNVKKSEQIQRVLL
jgi:hypothetical protein